MEGKWYIKTQGAEEEEYHVIFLTDAEYNAVRHFLKDSIRVAGGVWVGYCELSEQGFDTKEEAEEAIEDMYQ